MLTNLYQFWLKLDLLIETSTRGPGEADQEDPHGNLPQPYINLLPPTSRVSQQIGDDMLGLQDGSCFTSFFLISQENLSAGSYLTRNTQGKKEF